MLGWIIQVSIVSIIFIFVVHNLLVFLKTTLTVPKIKDLVNCPTQKYQNIYDTITHSSELITNNGYTEIDLLPTNETTNDSMKNDLKSFLKKQLSKDDGIVAFDSSSFSSF
jgi:hypothetical protein